MINENDLIDEELLLLSLCRLTFNEEQRRKTETLAGGIADWDYFASLANDHGLSALAGYNLNLPGIEGKVPPGILAGLKNAHHISLRRNVFLTELITKVLDHLNTAGISTVLIKGLALELTDYGNVGLRQMSDVDILIDHNKCVEAWNILKQNGFESLPLKSAFHKPILA